MWSNAIESIIEKESIYPHTGWYRTLQNSAERSVWLHNKTDYTIIHWNVTHEKVCFSNNSNKGWCNTHFDQKEERTVKEYEPKDKRLFFLHLWEDLQKQKNV